MEGINSSENTEVEIHYYIDESFDGERGLALFSVWHMGRPFMICQEAGRGNRDCMDRYITDAKVFSEFLVYVASLLPQEAPEALNPDMDIPALDEYHGCKTSDFYDPNLKPKFKVGDIVQARVLEDHLRDACAFEKAKWITTRCKVVRVNPFNPAHTYDLMQMDRRWETQEEVKARGGNRAEMVSKPNEGSVGATGNDSTVQPLE